jgi:hypothetical protein
MAFFSNIGPCVDIFAPGVNIMSSYIGGDAATLSLSGTSMSAPHVAGVLALLIGENIQAGIGDFSPAELRVKVTSLATEGIVNFTDNAEPTINAPIVPGSNPFGIHPPCDADEDCAGGAAPAVCCPGAGGKFCLGLFEKCCAESTCRNFPAASPGDVCCNAGAGGESVCCPEGTACTDDGSCFSPLLAFTPNLNLFSAP